MLQLAFNSMLLLVGSVALLSILNWYLSYRRVVRSINNHPGWCHLFPLYGIVANIIPAIPGVAGGYNWSMKVGYKPFAEVGWDVRSAIGLFPRVEAGFFLSDPVAIREVVLSRSRFPKPIELYKILSFFGRNIVVTEAEEWKKHRRISAPAFSEKNNKLVWDETVCIMLDMFDNWGSGPEVSIDNCVDITVKIALLVIGVAGFGRRVPWGDDHRIPPGHKLSFRDSLKSLSIYLQIKLITPRWMYPLSKYLRRVQLSFDELELYMHDMMSDRKARTVKEERSDLLNALLDAAEDEKEGALLTDSEIIGNIFIFFVAGHETTAHTLCFCFGLLALDQEEQEKLYQHIKSVLPGDKIPEYDDMNKLTYSMAAFNEALRLFPPVNNIPKYSAEDTTLPVIQPDGSKGNLSVRKGMKLILFTPGLHYNSRYWPDPEAFQPSRFLGDYPKDAFLPFSGGPRACIGRKFAETEAVAVISMLVRKYKIELLYPEQYVGLTQAEKRAKLLAHRPGVTTTPLNVPLLFKRR